MAIANITNVRRKYRDPMTAAALRRQDKAEDQAAQQNRGRGGSRVAGGAIQGTGKGVTAVSKAAARVPVVGVPVAAVGMGVGKTMEYTGRSIRRGKKANKKNSRRQRITTSRGREVVTNRVRQADIEQNDRKALKKAIQRRARTLFWINIWIIAPVVGVLNALIFYIHDLRETGLGEAVTEVAKSTLKGGVVGGTAQAGVYSAAWLGWLDGVFVGLWMLGTIISLAFLFMSFEMLTRKGAQVRGTIFKEPLLIFALVAAVWPFFNTIPWSAIWLWAIKRNPLPKKGHTTFTTFGAQPE